jgi:hypothetical protein
MPSTFLNSDTRAPGIDPARQLLLQRILSSRQFAHAHILKRVLQFVCQRSADPEAPSPKEHEIAIHAMGRPESFDSRTDPIVRVSMASIRDRLLAYFATEGRAERLRLTIPKGQYRAVFTETGSEEPAELSERPKSALNRFWEPYFAGEAANVIVYTEPLFFRDDRGHYIRDFYVNDPAAANQLGEWLPVGNLNSLSPCYHYLSAGEVHCLLSLSRMFHELGVPFETRNSRISSWNELRGANLILLGSPRTNTFLRSLQAEDAFLVTETSIEDRRPKARVSRSFRGSRYRDGTLPRMTEYAVITRRPSPTPGCAVTMIAANHGRAIEGAGHLLTLEDRVQKLLWRLETGGGQGLPPEFQFLMKVDTIDIDDEVVHVECIAHKVLARQSVLGQATSLHG